MKGIITYFVLGIILGLLIGYTLGITTVIHSTANAIKGFLGSTTINININETRLVDEFNRTIIPQIKKEVNQ